MESFVGDHLGSPPSHWRAGKPISPSPILVPNSLVFEPLDTILQPDAGA